MTILTLRTIVIDLFFNLIGVEKPSIHCGISRCCLGGVREHFDIFFSLRMQSEFLKTFGATSARVSVLYVYVYFVYACTVWLCRKHCANRHHKGFDVAHRRVRQNAGGMLMTFDDVVM
jgi:hypothetical protein